ncbi:MAG TPA: hypothetical protein VN854_00345 [Mycoplasmatales bacterium]|jgi:hypothetical protein|nr:hypothetical protein [Mycoplasmatales bacterium]
MFNIKHTKALFKQFSFYFLKQTALFFLMGPNGFYVLKMPRIFFFRVFSLNSFSLIFLNNYHFKSFIKLFGTYYNRLFAFYFFRLVLKGRGYRIKRFCKNLYRFYFIKVNYVYFHVPISVIVKIKKKHMFFLSYEFCVLRNLITYILLIKAVTAYRKRGFHYKRMLFLRKRGKKRN